MFNITNHYGNQNQNLDISLTLIKMAIIKMPKDNNW